METNDPEPLQIDRQGGNYLLCPDCGWPFRWDGIANGDECPHCKGYARAETQLVSQQQYYEIQEKKFFEMQSGGKLLISKYDYIHKYCGGIVEFDLNVVGRWKCPKCHLSSGLDALLMQTLKS